MENCTWEIYDGNAQGLLGVGLYIAGVLSVILCCIFLAALLKSSVLLEDRSHLMLLNLVLASLARSLVAGFLFSGSSSIAGRWLFGDKSCRMFGFLHQLLTVYMTEAITHMCIERYVLAKYIKNGWEMTASRYVLFIGLCCIFSLLYSVPVLLDVGGCSLDYSCTYCTFELVLPETLDKYIVIGILFLQSVKPVAFIISMLYWATQFEQKTSKPKENKYNIILTQSAKKIAFATLFCWSASFLTAALEVLSQLLYGIVLQPPLALAMTAALGSEIAPAVIVLTILSSNVKMRQAATELFGDSSHNKTS